MKIKTSELTGAALDWAVAVALEWKLERPQDGQFIDNDGNRWLGIANMRQESHFHHPPTGRRAGRCVTSSESM